MPTIAGQNYPGPYEMEFSYEVDSIIHKTRHNMDVTSEPNLGDPFNNISLLTKSGGTINADTFAIAFFDVWKLLYPADTTMVEATLWKYEVGTHAKDFISTYPIGQVGQAASAWTSMQQAIWTFRSNQGGIMRVDLLESISGGYDQRTYSEMTATEQLMADLITGSTSPVMARDNGYAFSVLRLHYSKNNALERKRTR